VASACWPIRASYARRGSIGYRRHEDDCGMLSRPARVSREDAPSALVLSPVGLPRAQVHQASGERYGHGYNAAGRGARSARAMGRARGRRAPPAAMGIGERLHYGRFKAGWRLIGLALRRPCACPGPRRPRSQRPTLSRTLQGSRAPGLF
jgi:hypothetical protein